MSPAHSCHLKRGFTKRKRGEGLAGLKEGVHMDSKGGNECRDSRGNGYERGRIKSWETRFKWTLTSGWRLRRVSSNFRRWTKGRGSPHRWVKGIFKRGAII